MATDGVKIIDGDLALDLYSNFTELYNEGADNQVLKQKYEDDKAECSCDNFSYEICVTVYALAFWEIGEMTAELLEEVKNVLSKNATIEKWTKEVNREAGNARRKELDNFLKKISHTNAKPKKRKKSNKKIKLFHKGDVLLFQYPDNSYGATFVVDINEYAGFCFYNFAITTYQVSKKPNVDDFIQNGKIITRILSDDSNDNIMTNLRVWVHLINHEDLTSFVQSFNKIGTISTNIQQGQSILAKNFMRFCEKSAIESEIEYAHSLGDVVESYPIKDILN